MAELRQPKPLRGQADGSGPEVGQEAREQRQRYEMEAKAAKYMKELLEYYHRHLKQKQSQHDYKDMVLQNRLNAGTNVIFLKKIEMFADRI